MIARFGPSWQTTTADLALILFLVVSAAQAGAAPSPESAPLPPFEVVETPSSAVYSPRSRVSIEDWLAAQGHDDRLGITVLVRRSGDPRSDALASGGRLLTRIEQTGRTARMIVEPGVQDEVSVILAYDRPDGMALAESGT